MSAKILIVEAPYYTQIADALREGACEALNESGASYEIIDVPGALEIPLAIKMAHESGKYDGFLALGCVIRGETTHYDIVCNESCRGLTLLGLEHNICIGNGILTCENKDQAMERASKDKKNKGKDVAEACLRLIELKKQFTA